MNIDELNFDNKFTRELPADPDTDNHPRQVTNSCFSKVRPTPVASPEVIAVSEDMLSELGLSKEASQSDLFRDVFSGNA